MSKTRLLVSSASAVHEEQPLSKPGKDYTASGTFSAKREERFLFLVTGLFCCLGGSFCIFLCCLDGGVFLLLLGRWHVCFISNQATTPPKQQKTCPCPNRREKKLHTPPFPRPKQKKNSRGRSTRALRFKAKREDTPREIHFNKNVRSLLARPCL